jgi:hypothetical protein
MSSPSDAEVIARSLSEPEAFGLIYDRHGRISWERRQHERPAPSLTRCCAPSPLMSAPAPS